MERNELEFLVQKIKNGDEGLFNKLYSTLYSDLRKMSAQYFIAGGDEADIMQECRIGLWKAVQDFQTDGGMSFKNFAVNICCKRHIITSVSHANRKKFIIHNSADSLDASSNEDDDYNLSDFIPDTSENALDTITSSEVFDESKEMLFEKLTKLEKSILNLYLKFSSYKEIASKLGIKSKTVDNALMRIRKKSTEMLQQQKQNGEKDV